MKHLILLFFAVSTLISCNHQQTKKNTSSANEKLVK
jgi:hypothetical protein